MAKTPVTVVVDEGWNGVDGSYLKVLFTDGKEAEKVTFERGASPNKIACTLNETGCLIKFDEGDIEELSDDRKEKIGDLFIEASFRVPGERR